MKRSIRLLLVALTILGLVGCGNVSSETSRQQSIFKQNFSIGTLIETHQELLIEGPRSLSGMEAGPPEPFEQNHEYMTIQVDSSNAKALMESIQSDIGENIQNSGATITGRSGFDAQADPIAYVSYAYSEGPFYGVINVWGLRGEGNSFNIISEITESKTQNKW